MTLPTFLRSSLRGRIFLASARLAVLTATGRKTCAEGTRLHEESERTLLKGLTRDEARQLGALLEKVGRPRS